MPVAVPRRSLVFVAAAALAAALAACGGAAASSSAHGVAAASAAKRATVLLHKTALGRVLVDARGRTLYLYTPDKGKKSVCYGECAAAWPPLLVAGAPTAGPGVKAGLLGVTMRKDGKHQVTYHGHPLYLFAGDKKAGQVNGQALKGVWWVLSAAGKQVSRTAKASVASATLQLRQTSLGTVLVDHRGMTLYLYTPDANGTSTCYGGCASAWPPLLASGKATVGAGLKSSLLGTTKRTDGTTQLTYGGHPLYLWAQDAKPGDVTGQGVGDVWYVVGADGSKIDDSSESSEPTTTTGGGY